VNVRALLRGVAFAAPWFLLHCGDSSDLIIGLIEPPEGMQPNNGGNGGGDAGPDSPGDIHQLAGAGGSSEPGVGGSAGEPVLGVAGAGPDPVDCEVGELPPTESLIHRWDFSGPGLVAIDSVSGANGDIIQPDETLDDGVVTFNGEGESYVNLPEPIVSTLTDATLVIWTTWFGGAAWQRVFDFGINDNGEDMRGRGDAFFMLANMPSTTDASEFGFLQLEFDKAGNGIDKIITEDFPKEVEHQYAVSVRGGVRIDLYVDAVLMGSIPTTGVFADIDDRNSWIGLSNTQGDQSYNGTFNEFRIYDAALSQCAIQSLNDAGPDTLP
jgi:hypothetical protein